MSPTSATLALAANANPLIIFYFTRIISLRLIIKQQSDVRQFILGNDSPLPASISMKAARKSWAGHANKRQLQKFPPKKRPITQSSRLIKSLFYVRNVSITSFKDVITPHSFMLSLKMQARPLLTSQVDFHLTGKPFVDSPFIVADIKPLSHAFRFFLDILFFYCTRGKKHTPSK